MKNTEQILISQSICNGTISGIFDTHKQFTPRPATGWWKTDTHEAFMKYVEELKKDGMHIYSLACDDDKGFGVFAMEGFGTEQEVTWAEDTDTNGARTTRAETAQTMAYSENYMSVKKVANRPVSCIMSRHL